MRHIHIKYNNRKDTNAVVKHKIYEVVKSLSLEYMGNNVTIVDTPGPAVIERTHQFSTPGFQYLAAEHNVELRNRLGEELFIGKEWWDLSQNTIRDQGTAVLSFDGTMSPINYLTDGFLERTYRLCDEVVYDKPFILNLCFTKRAGRNWKSHLPRHYSKLKKSSKPANQAVRLIRKKLFKHFKAKKRTPVGITLGTKKALNTFHYGNTSIGQANMANIIIPVLPNPVPLEWKSFWPPLAYRLMQEGTHRSVAMSMVAELWKEHPHNPARRQGLTSGNNYEIQSR